MLTHPRRCKIWQKIMILDRIHANTDVACAGEVGSVSQAKSEAVAVVLERSSRAEEARRRRQQARLSARTVCASTENE
jgi:hypothetical protein